MPPGVPRPCLGPGAADGDDKPTIFPSEAPLDGSRKTYDLRVVSATATAYELQAQPKSGGVQASDGTLYLHSSGKREWDKNGGGTKVAW